MWTLFFPNQFQQSFQQVQGGFGSHISHISTRYRQHTHVDKEAHYPNPTPNRCIYIRIYRYMRFTIGLRLRLLYVRAFDLTKSVFGWCLCLRRWLTNTQTNRQTARNSMTVKVLASMEVSRFIWCNRRSTATVTTSITKPILRTRFSRASNEGCEEFTETHLCCFDWHCLLRSTTCLNLEP